MPGLIESSVRFKEKVLLAWDLWIGVACALAVFAFVPESQISPLIDSLTSAGLAVAATLVGVVIAALAVVVAFLDDEFLGLMDRATRRYGGIEGQLFPFWFVTGLGILMILVSVGTVAFAAMADATTRRWIAASLTLLLVWMALGVLNLVGYLTSAGVSRAMHIRRKDGEE